MSALQYATPAALLPTDRRVLNALAQPGRCRRFCHPIRKRLLARLKSTAGGKIARQKLGRPGSMNVPTSAQLPTRKRCPGTDLPTSQSLMKIGQNQNIRRGPVPDLPTSWRILSTLAQLNDDDFKWAKSEYTRRAGSQFTNRLTYSDQLSQPYKGDKL